MLARITTHSGIYSPPLVSGETQLNKGCVRELEIFGKKRLRNVDATIQFPLRFDKLGRLKVLPMSNECEVYDEVV